MRCFAPGGAPGLPWEVMRIAGLIFCVATLAGQTLVVDRTPAGAVASERVERGGKGFVGDLVCPFFCTFTRIVGNRTLDGKQSLSFAIVARAS
jgi:hypothetical protein